MYGANESLWTSVTQRASKLAEYLSGSSFSRRVVYVGSSWGELGFSLALSPTGPTTPVPPARNWSWNDIPRFNAIYTGAMRRTGAVVVDPTLALPQRPDCRLDFIHLHKSVYLQSTWRMIQAALFFL